MSNGASVRRRNASFTRSEFFRLGMALNNDGLIRQGGLTVSQIMERHSGAIPGKNLSRSLVRNALKETGLLVHVKEEPRPASKHRGATPLSTLWAKHKRLEQAVRRIASHLSMPVADLLDTSITEEAAQVHSEWKAAKG